MKRRWVRGLAASSLICMYGGLLQASTMLFMELILIHYPNERDRAPFHHYLRHIFHSDIQTYYADRPLAIDGEASSTLQHGRSTIYAVIGPFARLTGDAISRCRRRGSGLTTTIEGRRRTVGCQRMADAKQLQVVSIEYCGRYIAHQRRMVWQYDE